MLLQAAIDATSIPLDTTTIVGTFITTVFAGGVGKFLQAYYKNKKEKRSEANAKNAELKDSLKTRVLELEEKVDGLQDKIQKMIDMYTEKIILLSTEKATLIAENKGLEHEIGELKEEIKGLTRD
jgi:hypothetical protein